MKLSKEELEFSNHSVDDIGKIFFYDGCVLRAIKANYKNFIVDLLESGLIDELVRKNLFPKTTISKYEIDGFALVLKHDRLDNWNYPYEWSFNMLKSAALKILDINQISRNYGYEIVDCHKSNLVFKFCNPIYIDIGGFRKLKKNKAWRGKKYFTLEYQLPLKLLNLGYEKIVYSSFLQIEYISKEEYLRIAHPLIRFALIEKFSKVCDKFDSFLCKPEEEIQDIFSKNKFLSKIVSRVHSFLPVIFQNSRKIKSQINKLEAFRHQSRWGNYHETLNPENSPRVKRIGEIISSLGDVNEVIEFAANQGKISSFLLENKIIKSAIAIDYDGNAVDKMFLCNKEKNLLPLKIDFMQPDGRIIEKKFTDRFSADLALALAVSHHLILSQGYDINDIFSILKKVTKKYVIIDFMPLGLYGGDIGKTPKVPDYYNLTWFKLNFSKHFSLILDEKVETNRHIFVGKLL